MAVKDQLLAILNGVDLEPEVKRRLMGLVEEGPITKSLVDDIANVLELGAKEQDQIEKIESQKADLYGEMAAQLEALEEEEAVEDEKNLNQLIDDLNAIADEAKTHLTETAPSVAPEITVPVETGTPTA